jgi:hypothetical protein
VFDPLAGDVMELHGRHHFTDVAGEPVPVEGECLHGFRGIGILFPQSRKIIDGIVKNMASISVLLVVEVAYFLEIVSDQVRENGHLIQQAGRLGSDVPGKNHDVVGEGVESRVYAAGARILNSDETAEGMELPDGSLKEQQMGLDATEVLEDRRQNISSQTRFPIQASDAREGLLKTFHRFLHFRAGHPLRNGGGELREFPGPNGKIPQTPADHQEISLCTGGNFRKLGCNGMQPITPGRRIRSQETLQKGQPFHVLSSSLRSV